MAKKTPGWLVAADRALSILSGAIAFAGALGILALLGITVVAVFWRYALNAPIFGISDWSVLTLTIVAAAAVSYGGRHNAHVSINLIERVASRKTRRVTDLIMRALTAVIIGLAVYALIDRACGIEKACITSNLSLEHRPFYYVLAVGLALYGLHVLVQLLTGLAHWNDAADPNEAQD